MFVRSAPGERAHDARRPPGGSLKSHPVVGVALTPRYSPRPRLDNVRPAAAPPEEPAEPDPVTGTPSTGSDEPEEPAALRQEEPVSTTPPGPTWALHYGLPESCATVCLAHVNALMAHIHTHGCDATECELREYTYIDIDKLLVWELKIWEWRKDM